MRLPTLKIRTPALRDFIHPLRGPRIKKIVAPVHYGKSDDLSDRQFTNLWFAANSWWASAADAGLALRGIATAVATDPARFQPAFLDKALEWAGHANTDYSSAAEYFLRKITPVLDPAVKQEITRQLEGLAGTRPKAKVLLAALNPALGKD